MEPRNQVFNHMESLPADCPLPQLQNHAFATLLKNFYLNSQNLYLDQCALNKSIKLDLR